MDIKMKEKPRLLAAQMKFVLSLLGLTSVDCQRNETIRSELKVTNIVSEIEEKVCKWKSHV